MNLVLVHAPPCVHMHVYYVPTHTILLLLLYHNNISISIVPYAVSYYDT